MSRNDTSGATVAADPPEYLDYETDPHKIARIMAARLPHYTETGFTIAETPPHVHQKLAAAYSAGLTMTRPEQSDPEFLQTGDPDYIEIGELAYEIGDQLHHLHEKWSGAKLELVASYGLRIYRRGQTLRWHGDRAETHVISSIVHIDNESDEPWPLHIEDHAGVEHAVYLEPGQMLFYESATCPHARPTPFDGEHYGSLFVHFKPITGWNVTEDDINAFTQLVPPPPL